MSTISACLTFPTEKEIRFLPVTWLTISSHELTHPLRSIPITGTSTLLRDDPPPCSALVLSSLWGLHLDFSLGIGTTGSPVPQRSLNQNHAAFMPSTTQAVSRFPLDLSRSTARTSVLMLTIQQFRHLISGSLTLVFLIHTWPQSLLRLSLNAHHNGSLPMQLEVVWNQLLQADPRGPPSSSVQLRTLYI